MTSLKEILKKDCINTAIKRMSLPQSYIITYYMLHVPIYVFVHAVTTKYYKHIIRAQDTFA